MSVANEASPDNIDVVKLFKALGRNWHRLLGLSLIAGAFCFGALSLVAPTFTSEALIAVVARGDANPFSDPKSAGSGEAVAVRVDREAVNTHARSLLAPELMAAVSANLQLSQRSEFNTALAKPGLLQGLTGAGQPKPGDSAEDRVLAVLAKRVTVTPAKDSRNISIRVQAKDREIAADIANRLADVYREQLASRSISESNNVQSGLAPRIDKLKQEVAEAEAEVERFRGAANLFRGGQASATLKEQQLGELTAAESKAKTELGEADARERSARELMSRGSIEVHPDVQRSPTVQKLVQDRARIEADIAKASATMKEGHPVLKQLRSEQAATARQINLEARRVVDGLEKEVSVATLRLASIQKSLTELKQIMSSTGGEQARLSQLEANAKAKRGELDRLQSQFEANQARSDVRVVPMEVQFISRARPASEPTFPKPLPYTGLAMVAALLLSSAFLIARELIVGARKPVSRRVAAESARTRPDTVTDHTPKVEPSLPGGEIAREPIGGDVGSISALAYRLMERKDEGRAKRTLLAGGGTSVDPSAEAVELARTMARSSRAILLLDWSLDGAGVARLLGIPTMPGLSELIDGKAGFLGAITRIPGSAAQMIPCGNALVSASARGDTDRLNMILDALDEIYDHILISARFAAARDLFETIEGRFDCGVLIGAQGLPEPPVAGRTRMFLGFEVEDIEILRLSRASSERRITIASRDMAA